MDDPKDKKTLHLYRNWFFFYTFFLVSSDYAFFYLAVSLLIPTKHYASQT